MTKIIRNAAISFFTVLAVVGSLRADDAGTLAVKPVAVDTLAAAIVPAADTAAPTPVFGPEPAPPAPSISVTGALLSLVIPGTGQIYHKKYILGAGFLAAEAVTGIVALNRWERWEERMDLSDMYRDTADIMLESGDTGMLYGAGLYSVWADRTAYEAYQTRYTAYNALAWTAGIYYYSFMDALERGGVTARGKAKNPTLAGLLAAVPFLGLGQLYNGHPGKAGMISMAQTALAMTAFNHHRLMGRAYDQYDAMRDTTSEMSKYATDNDGVNHLAYWKGRYDQAFSRRNTYLWISLFAYIYSIFDAVVDAHLSDYNERINFGPDLSIGGGGGGVSLDLTVGF